VVGAFGCAGFDLSTQNADPGFYVEDGTVVSSLESEGYYDYLQYFIGLYRQGIILPDFYSAVTTAASMDALSLGSSIIWSADGGLIDSMTATGEQEIPSYELVGIASIHGEGETGYHFSSALSTVDTDGTCVSATCDDPERALEMLNWFYTPDGQTFCTWGVEDVTYTVENGEPQFTEAVTDGIFPVNLMYGFYVWSPCGMYRDKSVLYSQYSDRMLSAYALWGEDDAANTLPSGLSLTAQESDAYTSEIGDIITYASEQILRFILGEDTLDEASWQSFGETLDNMGLRDCVEIYQNAYDRYLGRVG
jgi:putative aldouronate transport system substrate-binding protein